MEPPSDNLEQIVNHSKKQILYIKCNVKNYTDFDKCLTEESVNAIKILRDNHLKLERFDYNIALEYSRDIGEFLVVSGVSVILREISCYVLNKSWFNNDGSVNDWNYNLFSNTFGILINFSEGNEALCTELCQSNFFNKVIIPRLHDIHIHGTKDQPIHDTLKLLMTNALGLLLNCSQIKGNRQSLLDLDIYPLLYDISINSTDNCVKLSSILLLANVLADDEKENLEVDSECIQFLLTSLSETFEEEEHRSYGFTAIELIKGIRKLSCNDKNKILLVNNGALDVLHNALIWTEDKERLASMETLLSLSFIDENKVQMTADDEMIIEIYEIWDSNSSDEFLKDVAHRTLWNLKDSMLKKEYLEGIAQQVIELDNEEIQCSDEHIMISYSWAQQELAIKIRDGLQKRRYRTWMDIDQMDDMNVHCITNAIQNSDVVLVFMSSEYGNSDNCRLELEYALECKKRVIPLICQSDYKPDGWLGKNIESKFDYDFSEKYSFEYQLEELVKALGDCGKKHDEEAPVVLTDSFGKLYSILAQANTLTDEEKENLVADSVFIQFLLESLHEALENNEHRRHGFTAIELTNGIRQLLCNDKCKELMVDNGAIDVLKKMLFMPGIKNLTASMETLLSLSYIDVNKKQMMADEVLINKFYETWNSTGALKETTYRTLVNLKDYILSHESFKHIAQQVYVTDDEYKHIMISYNWKQKKLVTKIRNELLRRGYRVWMDIDNMKGSMVDCVEKAIKDSYIVLVCMSSHYNNSENCKEELEYARKIKKRIIPLLCQSKFVPEGWLSFIIGSKLYYDFSKNIRFNSVMAKLVKCLDKYGTQ